MRIAFISDIHANLEALDTVLDDIKKAGADEICCLGDIVGYGANPNECIDRVSKYCGENVLLGNHDAVAIGLMTTRQFNVHARAAIEWTAEKLSAKNRRYLSTLPLTKAVGMTTMVHATPYEPKKWYYITSLEDAAFNFQYFDTRICVIGHTHIPTIMALDDEEIYSHEERWISYAGKKDLRLLVNVGSVGQPRDRNKDSSYGLLDTDKKTFTLKRVPYNVEKAQAKMRKAKMPEFLINRLAEGR
ncbi:MAG: metallophosphatase family protein [Chitinispirillales bacterium]|jgi:predicted phosphodiesterase|nr:metallophosphatase family protein [Chitinispirillales bacterium]